QRAAEELRLVVRASRLRFVIQRQRHADLIDRLL
ncbi:MAG: guanylate kinase, partial [Betaproteobacteria bacterium]|nr:guanylate kinase [Betaproteobacteria bacterium]